MEFDAFAAGVAPGGLRLKSDIRILICYILKSVAAPLSQQDLMDIMQQKGLANYFEAQDALVALAAKNHVRALPQDCYEITETGKEIADSLDVTLPLSVRDKALEAAFSLLGQAKVARENHVEITQTTFGYNVSCHISGGDFDLMQFTLYVPDLGQAKMVKRNFHKDPAAVYRLLLTSITGNSDLAVPPKMR